MQYVSPTPNQLKEGQGDFLAAIIVSVSRKASDAYLSYINYVGEKHAEQFAALQEECLQSGWIRTSKHQDKSFIYLTADGWCVALFACQMTSQKQLSQGLRTAIRAPGAHYARLYSSWFMPHYLWSVDEELLEQSINDSFHLLTQSDQLWYLVKTLPFAQGAGDYFVATYPRMLLTATSPATYDTLHAKVSGLVKRTLPIQLSQDVGLFSSNPSKAKHFLEPLDEHYLVQRESLFSLNPRTRLSLSLLIDLFILQCLRPESVAERIEQLEGLDAACKNPLGFFHWQKLFDYLQMGDDTLVTLFYDAPMWLESVHTPQGIAWGQLVLDLLQMCRVKTRPELRDFFTTLAHHPLAEPLDSSKAPAQFNLAHMAQRLFAYLTDEETDQGRFIDKPDAWQMWISEVTTTLRDPKEQQDERLAWVISEHETLMIKRQKRGKKGWSIGRKVAPHTLLYDNNLSLASIDLAIAENLQSRHDFWSDTFKLNPTLLMLLSQSNSVFNSVGEPISLVAEPALVVLEEEKGQLALQCHPKVSKQSQACLKPRTEGIYSFYSIPEHVERFFTLAGQMPAVAIEQAEALIERLGDNVNWYFISEARGNITLGEWDTTPHLWLKLGEGKLELAIEHQSQDQRTRIGSGQDTLWLYQQGKIWYRRDLAQERQQAKAIAKALGLKACKNHRYSVPSQQLPQLLDALEQLEEVTIHWHQASKRVKQLRSQDVGLAIRQQEDWFQVSGDVHFDGAQVLDLKRLLEARRTGFITLEQQNLTLLVSDALRKQLHFLDSVLDDNLSVNRQLAYPLQKLIETMSVQSDQGWQALQQAWSQPITLDEALLEPLRDYQRNGVLWAAHLLHNGFGVCLADDMGLGKTLQALTLLSHFQAQGPSLVVCPKSVLLNWRQESQRFTQQLTVIDLERCADRQQTLANARAGEVIVLSYGLVTRLADALQATEWQTVVLDEAQQIKNPNAERAKVLFEINAQRRITLSGTPVENHLVELWSQFAFLNPGLLGSLKQFKSKYAQASKNEDDLLRLRALVSPFILRRLKQEVLTELPEKTELVHHVELTSKERNAYEAVRKEALETLSDGSTHSTISLFASLTRLRQVCCDPGLVFEHLTDTSSKQKEALQLVEDALEGGHKILVFSQFVQLLKRFGQQLKQHGVDFSYLDGQATSKQRQSAINAFKSGEHHLFLISLKAGGSGLNLTEADTVIHLDPWWNPAVEDQASDRAYRMGQTKPVTVYRLVTVNTVEEKIIQLHSEKRDLADKVLSGQSTAEQLNPELLMQLMTE